MEDLEFTLVYIPFICVCKMYVFMYLFVFIYKTNNFISTTIQNKANEVTKTGE